MILLVVNSNIVNKVSCNIHGNVCPFLKVVLEHYEEKRVYRDMGIGMELPLQIYI